MDLFEREHLKFPITTGRIHELAKLRLLEVTNRVTDAYAALQKREPNCDIDAVVKGFTPVGPHALRIHERRFLGDNLRLTGEARESIEQLEVLIELRALERYFYRITTILDVDVAYGWVQNLGAEEVDLLHTPFDADALDNVRRRVRAHLPPVVRGPIDLDSALFRARQYAETGTPLDFDTYTKAVLS